ncbi:phage late control D family protein [Brevibacillus fortis]|uniref:phage late control D family protein n=1 Tax=Brevibacillus fortis TaxID=2126352 RepID=UPI0038FC893F
MKARRAKLQVIYDNHDITADLHPHLISWTHTDNLSGQADDLQITVEDKERKWSGPWMPEEGAVLRAKVIRENWEQDGKTDYLSLGQFEIDGIEISFPPSAVTIKAISVPESSSLRGEPKNRAWEKTKLSVIAGDKAKKSGLKLFFDAEDVEYDRIEQTEETDLVFLMRLCNDAGLCLKITDKQLVIFDEEKYESRPAIDTIKRDAPSIKSFRTRLTTQGAYRACRVEYQSPKKKKKVSYTYTPPSAPKTGRTLYVNQRVTSIGEAQRLARKKLREANKDTSVASVVMIANNVYVAGHTVNLKDFGQRIDGKYIITQITRSQGSGYEMAMELRRCLEGY